MKANQNYSIVKTCLVFAAVLAVLDRGGGERTKFKDIKKSSVAYRGSKLIKRIKKALSMYSNGELLKTKKE